MNKVALITGVTGQDGSYLAESLLNKSYTVHGIKRRSSTFNTSRIDHLYRDPHEPGVRFFLHHGDLSDSSCLIRIIKQVQPDEIYNLAAQSHVAVSFEEPEYIATGEHHSVRDFIELAAAELGMTIRWESEGVDEKGFVAGGRQIISVDKRYFRPTEVESLLGDATKAKIKLGWVPKITFRELVSEMVRSDLNEAKRQAYLNKGGF